jgi:UDP-glucose 4-epimerase
VNGAALVTGARGFIGRHVARHLAGRGWRVSGIGHGDWPGAAARDWGLSEWHSGEVSLEHLVACAGRPGLIVHCAGGASVAGSIERPDEDFHRTVSSTAAVLEFARSHARGAAVVFPSSAAVYGEAQQIPIPETAPLRPISPYGTHKLMAEELCRGYARDFQVAVAVVRLFSVYGPGLRKQLWWDACGRLARQEPARFSGDGTETRDWLHVLDAVALLEIAARRASSDCPVVNGGCGCPVALAELLAQFFALRGRTDQPVFAGAGRKGDPKHYAADIGLARSWGWVPAREWRKGVEEYLDWYRRDAT